MANIDSINAFIDGREKFGYNENTIFVKDGVLYSFSDDWPIALRSIGGDILINESKRSASSSKHVIMVTLLLSKRDIPFQMRPLRHLQSIIEARKELNNG